MTDKLSLYKGTLRVLGERPIASLTEDRPPRHTLDDIWDSGIIDLALQAGFWHFAMRTIQIEYTGDFTPPFGYQRAFEKPADWIRTAAISLDDYFNTPLNRFADEAGYWFADQDTLYIKFISNREDFGGDIGKWPINFCRYFETLMAAEAAERITQNRVKKGDLVQIAESLATKARSTDAMNQPVSFPPRGNWATARMRGWSSSFGRYSGGWERQ